MKQILLATACIGLLLGCSESSDKSEAISESNTATEQANMTTSNTVSEPPRAQKIDHFMTIHGDERNDEYYWLRDDTRQNKAVLDYLNAENEFTAAQLSHTTELQEQLFEEMTARLEPNVESIPVFDNGYWYWSKYEEGKDYPIYIRQKGSLEAPQEVLLDENKRAEGHEFYSLAAMKISTNDQLLAIAEDIISRRQYKIRIMDLNSGEFYPEVIENTSGQIVWANDNKTLFYVRKHPTTLLPYQVYRHELGTSPDQDQLIYEEKDTTFYTGIFKTRSDNLIGIGVSDWSSRSGIHVSQGPDCC